MNGDRVRFDAAILRQAALRRAGECGIFTHRLNEKREMILAHAEIELGNPRGDSLKPATARALAAGATTLCLPEHLAIHLKLEEIKRRDVVTADGREHSIPYAGPIRARFDNRNSFSDALVIGDSVLMGAIRMEDRDLVVHPRAQTAAVNPASPNTPLVIVK